MSAPLTPCSNFPRRSAFDNLNAFSLIELVVVLAIVMIAAAFVTPAFTSINSSEGVPQAAYDIKGILDQARSFATANNTYVYVGFSEVNGGVDASVVPQINTGSSSYGRVAVAVIATRDGTCGYGSDVSNWLTNYDTSTKNNLIAVNKVKHFQNVHLADLGSNPPSSGGMRRPAISNNGVPSYNVGNEGCISATPFPWPLGAPVPKSATAAVASPTQYGFYKVIQFDPQGVARIQCSTSAASIVAHYIEIALQQTHGNAKPQTPSNQNVGNLAAIQIDSVSGATRIYRP